MSEQKLGKTTMALGGVLETIPIDLIDLDSRYREDMGNMEELKLSLKELGQLQNLVVTTNDSRYTLRAGGRRLVAMRDLGFPDARCLIFNQSLTELDLLRIELEENSRRKDFNWKEEVKLKKRIYDLMVATHGEKTCSMDTDGVSMRDVAKMADVSPATMSLDKALARAIEVAPDIFEGCKNKTEARKQLNKISDTLIRQELAQRCLDRIESAGTTSSQANLTDKYIVKDFFIGVKDIPDSCINLVELDPPYAVNLQKIKRGFKFAYNEEDYNEVDVKDYQDFMKTTLTECWRVMANDAWLILWHAPDPWGPILFDMASDIGFTGTKLTGKWIKPNGQTMQPERYLANACEEFFYLAKGTPSIIRQGHTNIFPYTPVAASKKTHPTERPLDLILDVLSTFTWENSSVLVPFLGSGKTLIAAKMLNMNAFGFELTAAFKDGYTIAVNDAYEKGLLK